MGFLLDTCVVSEFTRQRPDQNVVDWFAQQLPDSLFISTISTGEIRRGIERLPDSKRRGSIESWFDGLKHRYSKRLLSFDLRTSEIWGKIKSDTERLGQSKSDTDMQIAATAIAHGHIIATRNIKDFQVTGVSIYNPWDMAWY